MFFVHETHQVIGRRASDFESIYREEVLPGLAHQSGCRLLWYLNHALGSGPAYNAVTITGIVDGTVWERYNIALMEGEHADLVERLDACRHEPDIPFSVEDTPGTEAMFSAFSKYEPSLLTNSLFNELAVGGWVDGLLFAAAAQAGGVGVNGPATSAGLINGLYDLHATTLGGMSPPLTFNRGKPNSADCWYWMATTNKQFTTPYGVSPTCAT